MTCPDWTLLAAHRLADAPEAAAPTDAGAWGEALGHLDGCPECRRSAVAADPTLVFRSLPAWEPDAAEVDAMRAGVAALRRVHRVAPASEGPREARTPLRRAALRERAGWRMAAAAGLAAALLSVAPVAERLPGDPAGSGASAGRLATGAGFPIAAFLEDPNLPAVDDIENPTASVYHLDDERVGVVMVVDAGLDV
ncbi:MAG TPA: hypothetical protein VLF66_02000 [Thermoanaerobaculia bacterium]|nr:hypothetical protein [Thermoanaerobaculia bacterium]